MKKLNIFISLLCSSAVLGVASSAIAANYTFEVSTEKPWVDSGTSSTDSQTVRVRSYVPGSNSVTFRNITLYTSTYTSGANALGDVVGTIYSIYGSGHTAWVDPYDGPKRTIIYPDSYVIHTELSVVNDQRIAAGNYYGSGNTFLYDVMYDEYKTLRAPYAAWVRLADLNNQGQIVGMQSSDGGYTRKGFIYDCANGFQSIQLPGASWTIPVKIDDQGNIYGYMTGIADAGYFIAHPDVQDDLSGCQLFPRDDVPPPVEFGNTFTFEMSGDFAQSVKIADFDGRGMNDLLVYHETGKTILYFGEEGFDKKIRYSGNEFFTLSDGVVIDTEWDLNNDGVYDKMKSKDFLGNRVYLSKPDGSFYYVPQKLPAGFLKYADFNGDGLVDLVLFDGAFASISYQLPQSSAPIDPAPAQDTTATTNPVPDTTSTTTTTDPAPAADTTTTTTTVTDPAPAGDSGATTSGAIPAISSDAEKVELELAVAVVNENNVVLTSGQTLWITSDTDITYNDSTGFEAGQDIQFKAWENPDSALIGISVELP